AERVADHVGGSGRPAGDGELEQLDSEREEEPGDDRSAQRPAERPEHGGAKWFDPPTWRSVTTSTSASRTAKAARRRIVRPSIVLSLSEVATADPKLRRLRLLLRRLNLFAGSRTGTVPPPNTSGPPDGGPGYGPRRG